MFSVGTLGWGGDVGGGVRGWGGMDGRWTAEGERVLTRDDWTAAQQNGAAAGVHVAGVVLGTGKYVGASDWR